jgi:hypothetical protein
VIEAVVDVDHPGEAAGPWRLTMKGGSLTVYGDDPQAAVTVDFDGLGYNEDGYKLVLLAKKPGEFKENEQESHTLQGWEECVRS